MKKEIVCAVFIALASFLSAHAQRGFTVDSSQVVNIALVPSNAELTDNFQNGSLYFVNEQDAGNFDLLKTAAYRIPGLREKKVGTKMMTGGLIFIVAGIVMYSKSIKGVIYTQGTTNYYDAKYIGGIALMAVGTGIMVPGYLVWRRGVRINDKYLIEQQKLSFHFHGTGGSLSYRF